VKTTAGQAGISGRELKAVPLELPDLAEQQRRIDQFDEADQALTHLDASLRFAFQRATRLRRALLAEAFSGRLVPQDSADESALELLARIEAERASLATSQAKSVRRARTASTTVRAPKETTTVPVGVQEELPL
jgi:type I restriction enzyme S subunit